MRSIEYLLDQRHRIYFAYSAFRIHVEAHPDKITAVVEHVFRALQIADSFNFHFHRFTLFLDCRFCRRCKRVGRCLRRVRECRLSTRERKRHPAAHRRSSSANCANSGPNRDIKFAIRNIASPVMRSENSIEEIPLATGSSGISPQKSTSGTTRTGWPLTIRTASPHSRSPIAATF